jgi:hypothetical protein
VGADQASKGAFNMARHTVGRDGINRRAWGGPLWIATAAALTGVPIASSQVAAPAPNPPAAVAPVSPAVDEVQQDIDQKQYAAAIKAAGKLLSLHGDAAAGFSRFQVTMLKGDAQVGARSLSAARSTYQAALHETHDPHEQALATWTLELFRRARGTTYVPHVAGPAAAVANNGPIDLTDPQNRRAAFAALLEDQLSALGPALKRASGTASLPQILPVVKQVQALAELDEIANGSDARTAATAGGLLEHARNLMANALKGMWTRISDISAAATQQVSNTGTAAFVNGLPVQQTTTSENGLTGNDANELRAMIDTCGKIHDAATVFMPLAHGDDDKAWGAILNDATRVAGRAADVLNGNYSSTTATNYPGDSNGTGILQPNVYGNNNVYYPPGTNGAYSGTFPGNNGTTTPPIPSGGGRSGGTPPTPTPPSDTPPASPPGSTSPTGPDKPVRSPPVSTLPPPGARGHTTPPN